MKLLFNLFILNFLRGFDLSPTDCGLHIFVSSLPTNCIRCDRIATIAPYGEDRIDIRIQISGTRPLYSI